MHADRVKGNADRHKRQYTLCSLFPIPLPSFIYDLACVLLQAIASSVPEQSMMFCSLSKAELPYARE